MKTRLKNQFLLHALIAGFSLVVTGRVTAQALSVAFIQPTNNSITVAAGSTVGLAVSVVGTGPFGYQWQLNGTNLPNGIITTVAGGGSDYLGDGGPATNAELNALIGVAVDATGNLFFADFGDNVIHEVDANGIITTVAGDGTQGYSGDGGVATNATLNNPAAVAVDATGNLFIADSDNNVIREVGINGIITTVAGNGNYGYSGDGGAATNAAFNNPAAVAVDATGNLFITDSGNNVIREVGINGIITTVAGNGNYGYSGDGGAATNAAFNNPAAVAVDATGNLFITDSGNNVIREVGINGIITTVAGNGNYGYSGDGGAATNAEFANPSDVAVDANGNLFIADSGNGVIREVRTNEIITTVAGGGSDYPGDGGPATNAEFANPSDVAVDTIGNLFISDSGNDRIRKVVIQGPTLVLNDVGIGNAGAYDVVVSGLYGSVTSSVVNVAIALQVTTTGLPNGTNHVAYRQQLSAAYGQPPYSWSLFDGSLPSGLTLATTGLISGTPTTNGTFNFTVQVTDATNNTATQALALTLFGPPSVAIIQPTNNSITVAAGSTMSLAVAVMGNGPFSYQWQLNGTNLPNGIITTVAGSGAYGYSGDGGAAINAALNDPSGVAVDATGNLFIAEPPGQIIREVGTNGIITTVAGNRTQGYFGDGGPATKAEFYYPVGVAVDATGNLFIADNYNNVIREVDPNGIITTVAGDGPSYPASGGYSGDGGPATNAELNYPPGVAVDTTGNLFIADQGNDVIREVGTNGIIATVAGGGSNYPGDGGPATSAELGQPSGVAVDATGNLFIALASDVIRKVDANGIITTVAGNGTQGYSGNGGQATNAELYLDDYVDCPVAADTTGNLFIADYGNNVIREVRTNGIITTVAGKRTQGYSGDGGAATNAELNDPAGVAVDATGNLFIADSGNGRIRKVVIQGPTLVLNDVGGGNAGAYDVVVSNPYGSVTSSVVNVTIALGVTTTGLPNGTNGAACSHQLSAAYGQPPYSWSLFGGSLPSGLTLAANGLISGTPTTNGTFNFTVQVTDATNSTATQALALTVFGPPSVAIIQPTNNSVAVAAGSTVSLAVSATGFGPFSYQWKLNGTNLPNGIITTVAGNGSGGGAYSGDGGPATNAALNSLTGVAVDTIGNLFITEEGFNVIREVGANGIITTMAGNGAQGYSGDGGAATNAEFYYPNGVAVDTTGNLFIADSYNEAIRKVGTNGIIMTVAGNGYHAGPYNGGYSGDGGAATNAELNDPNGVAVDANGNLFIADTINSVIREVGTNGIITTVVGNGTYGYTGDGGAAANAELAYAAAVAVDANGNLFIVDQGNDVIREVDTNGIITTVAGNGAEGYSGDGGAATNAELYLRYDDDAAGPDVAVDTTGNLFIADSENNVIREVRTNGIITTVAGNGTQGYSGDGGAATSAELYYPDGVAVDANGNLFISDSGDVRIRKVVIQGPTLVLNDVNAGSSGTYDVVVSSPYGSVTSSVVNVTITPSVMMSVPHIIVGQASFNFLLSGPVGSNYVLQVSTNLLNWSPVSTSSIPVSGAITLSNSISGYNQRFYRVYLQ